MVHWIKSHIRFSCTHVRQIYPLQYIHAHTHVRSTLSNTYMHTRTSDLPSPIHTCTHVHVCQIYPLQYIHAHNHLTHSLSICSSSVVQCTRILPRMSQRTRHRTTSDQNTAMKGRQRDQSTVV